MDHIDKASKIRLLIIDVDGVLTDGRLHFHDGSIQHMEFHVHDGLGIKLLLQTGVQIGIITTRDNDIVRHRCKMLGIEHYYLGYSVKQPAYEDLLAKLNLSDEQVAYVGDDLPDLPLIRRSGLGIAVANATSLVREHADWVTHIEGGFGAIREVCEMLMQAQGTFKEITQKYL